MVLHSENFLHILIMIQGTLRSRVRNGFCHIYVCGRISTVVLMVVLLMVTEMYQFQWFMYLPSYSYAKHGSPTPFMLILSQQSHCKALPAQRNFSCLFYYVTQGSSGCSGASLGGVICIAFAGSLPCCFLHLFPSVRHVMGWVNRCEPGCPE